MHWPGVCTEEASTQKSKLVISHPLEVGTNAPQKGGTMSVLRDSGIPVKLP